MSPTSMSWIVAEDVGEIDSQKRLVLNPELVGCGGTGLRWNGEAVSVSVSPQAAVRQASVVDLESNAQGNGFPLWFGFRVCGVPLTAGLRSTR